jgi:hypothetical protein
MVEDSPYILVTKFGIAILAPKVVVEKIDSAILAHMQMCLHQKNPIKKISQTISLQMDCLKKIRKLGHLSYNQFFLVLSNIRSTFLSSRLLFLPLLLFKYTFCYFIL